VNEPSSVEAAKEKPVQHCFSMMIEAGYLITDLDYLLESAKCRNEVRALSLE